MFSLFRDKKDPSSPDRDIVQKPPKFVPVSDISHFRQFLEDFFGPMNSDLFLIAALRPWFEYASFEYKEAYFSDNLNFDL